MTMIVPVAGKTGAEILQTLKSEGVNATLADLLQVSGAASANELPSFWAINNGVITGAANDRASLITVSEPEPAPASEPAPHGGLTLPTPEATPLAIPSQQFDSGAGTPVLPVNVLAEFPPEVQAVATAGLGGTTAATAAPTATTPVPAEPLLGIKRTATPTTPSGYIPITETTTQTTSQEQDLKRMENLLSEQLRISTELSNLNLGKTQEEATAALEAITDRRTKEEEMALAREERQKLQTAREAVVLAQVEAATLEYKNAELDTGRIWKKKGTGSRILAAIAAGLGAYASAMSGTKNFALEIIKNAISDDIDAQKSEIAQKGTVIAEQRNLLSDLVRKGMSDTEAENAAQVIMLSQVQTMLQERIAKIKSGSVKREGELLQQQLNNEKEIQLETLRLNVAPKKVVTVTEKQKADPALTLKTKFEQARATSLGRIQGEREGERAHGLSAEDKAARTVPGYIGLANTPKQADQAIQANQDIIKLEQALDELIAMKQEFGYDNPLYSKARTSAQSKSILMVSMLKSGAFLDLGVLQEADMKLLERAVSMDPLGEISTDLVMAQYDAIKQYVKLSRDVIFKTLGLTPQTGVLVDVTKEDIRDQFRASAAAYNK
jgi:hypothetical protein